MPYKAGDEMFYACPKGNVVEVVANENEHAGAVSITDKKTGNWVGDIGTFHIFRTHAAAIRAARHRFATRGK